jgi:hypothetical protein
VTYRPNRIASVERQIRAICKKKLQNVSYTISPAGKNRETGEIESLFTGLDYYLKAKKLDSIEDDKYIFEKVIVQKKHMGSYCDIYLHRDIQKSEFYSRSGFGISFIREKLISAVEQMHARVFAQLPEAELVIIQSELMPWSVLGKGLVENNFKTYALLNREHQEYMKDLYPVLTSMRNDEDYLGFANLASVGDIAKAKKEYKHHIYSQYSSLNNIYIPTEDPLDDIDEYDKQISLYDSDGEPYFEPFNILKIINEDGTVKVVNSVIDSGRILGIQQLEVTLDNYEEAKKFYDDLVAAGAEGVVIKPDSFDPSFAPALKVRNTKYLQMIYGLDFSRNYDHYFERRRTGRKIKYSINEAVIASKINRMPLDQIGSKEYKKLIEDYAYEDVAIANDANVDPKL